MVPSVTAYRLSLYGKTAFLWLDTDASLATAEPLLLCEQQVDDECQLAQIVGTDNKLSLLTLSWNAAFIVHNWVYQQSQPYSKKQRKIFKMTTPLCFSYQQGS